MHPNQPSNYVYQEYPKCLYHEIKGTATVQNRNEEKALGRGWTDSPAKFGKGFWPRLVHLKVRFLESWWLLFPRDYWSMNDKDLEKVALRYGIGAGSPTGGYLREYAIEKLVQRDTTLRTRFNVALAFIKIFVPSGIGLTILYALYRFAANALRGMF